MHHSIACRMIEDLVEFLCYCLKSKHLRTDGSCELLCCCVYVWLVCSEKEYVSSEFVRYFGRKRTVKEKKGMMMKFKSTSWENGNRLFGSCVKGMIEYCERCEIMDDEFLSIYYITCKLMIHLKIDVVIENKFLYGICGVFIISDILIQSDSSCGWKDIFHALRIERKADSTIKPIILKKRKEEIVLNDDHLDIIMTCINVLRRFNGIFECLTKKRLCCEHKSKEEWKGCGHRKCHHVMELISDMEERCHIYIIKCIRRYLNGDKESCISYIVYWMIKRIQDKQICIIEYSDDSLGKKEDCLNKYGIEECIEILYCIIMYIEYIEELEMIQIDQLCDRIEKIVYILFMYDVHNIYGKLVNNVIDRVKNTRIEGPVKSIIECCIYRLCKRIRKNEDRTMLNKITNYIELLCDLECISNSLKDWWMNKRIEQHCDESVKKKNRRYVCVGNTDCKSGHRFRKFRRVVSDNERIIEGQKLHIMKPKVDKETDKSERKNPVMVDRACSTCILRLCSSLVCDRND